MGKSATSKKAQSKQKAGKSPVKGKASVPRQPAKPLGARKGDKIVAKATAKKSSKAGSGRAERPDKVAAAKAKTNSDGKKASKPVRQITLVPALPKEEPDAKVKASKKSAGAATASSGTKSARARQAAVELPEVLKTPLSDRDLDVFRQMLLEKRQEILSDMAHLEDEAIRPGANAGGSSSMPIHMADLGSDTWEREFTLGLIENERGLLREIDEALCRIEDKTYGVCLATGKPITKARLKAKPWAKYCIEYARRRELGLA